MTAYEYNNCKPLSVNNHGTTSRGTHSAAAQVSTCLSAGSLLGVKAGVGRAWVCYELPVWHGFTKGKWGSQRGQVRCFCCRSYCYHIRWSETSFGNHYGFLVICVQVSIGSLAAERNKVETQGARVGRSGTTSCCVEQDAFWGGSAFQTWWRFQQKG